MNRYYIRKVGKMDEVYGLLSGHILCPSTIRNFVTDLEPLDTDRYYYTGVIAFMDSIN